MGVALGVGFSEMIWDLIVVPPLAVVVVVVAVVVVLLLVTLQLFALSTNMQINTALARSMINIKPPLSASYHLLVLVQVQVLYSLESLH